LDAPPLPLIFNLGKPPPLFHFKESQSTPLLLIIEGGGIYL